jgi:hypothetical protein
MLCPGCVLRSTPQAQRVHELFRNTRLRVIGLHTVFEHHAAMSNVALEAYLHEFKITFPVAVDEPNGDGVPKTMARYELRGTPSTLLLDAHGVLRHRSMGGHEDLLLGAEISALLAEAQAEANLGNTSRRPTRDGYDHDEICRTPTP